MPGNGVIVTSKGPVIERLVSEGSGGNATFSPGGNCMNAHVKRNPLFKLLVPILVAFKFCQGLIVQQALVSFGSMMADVVDEQELASGRRQEGVFFGAVAFSGKGASGIGTMVAGVGLDVIGWQTGLAVHEIPPDLLIRLGLFYGPVVAGFAVVSVWCYTHYHLDRARHKEIVAKLKTARASRTEASPEPA